MIKISNKKKFTIFIIAILLIACTIIFGVYKITKWKKGIPETETMTISKASKIGEKKTVQLLIQIVDWKNVQGALERGDVVLSAHEDKQFSIAEQEGFLIIKIRLTESEQQLLELSLKQQPGFLASEQDWQNPVEIKRRKFAVDLEKIGIKPEEKTGKIISNKIFEDDVLIEKEIK